MSIQKVFVTTTESLEGWEIDAYLGPVFSHIVAGTGFFSDLAASLSDVFGGRSQTYQKQLSEINVEAIELLKIKASLQGGNLILGLRIDHDEISGKAKQMFMVTASGTAAHGTQKSSARNSPRNSPFLSSDALEIALTKREIVDKCKTVPISLSDEEWNFATENQLHEIAPQVLATLQQSLEQEHYQEQGLMDKLRKYFLALPSVHSVPALYESLRTNDLLIPFVQETVFQGELFDCDALISLVASGQFRLQKWALALAQSNQPFYSADDIKKLSVLVETIKTTFVERAKFIEDKAKFGSSVKQKWLCECGGKNDKERERCSICSRDTYGFAERDTTPQEVIESIQSKVNALKDYFN